MKRKFNCEVDCAGCASRVEDAIRKVDGVNDVQINFMTGRMTLDADENRFKQVLEKARNAGQKVDPYFEIF
ncbi:MAG: heavy metal-associated domain-containing protein [Lachnospiraceae bacterium]|nr:heavy metal-associated domain-containing protein [Lachnospiraceae bacterium]